MHGILAVPGPYKLIEFPAVSVGRLIQSSNHTRRMMGWRKK
jgi:hypothetical protein